MKQGTNLRKIYIGTLGGLLLLIGIVAIPYPGPGWLIIFLALGVLGSEFVWAQRVLRRARGIYDRFVAWLARQPIYIRIISVIITAIIVVLTVYLLNGYGIINRVFSLNMDWLRSPFPIFR